MKSITIHGLDENLDKLIKRKAYELGLSLNKTIKSLLGNALGLSTKNNKPNYADFQDLFGIWKQKDAELFLASIKDFSTIDEEDWR